MSERPYEKDARRPRIMHRWQEDEIIVWNWDTSNWDKFTKATVPHVPQEREQPHE